MEALIFFLIAYGIYGAVKKSAAKKREQDSSTQRSPNGGRANASTPPARQAEYTAKREQAQSFTSQLREAMAQATQEAQAGSAATSARPRSREEMTEEQRRRAAEFRAKREQYEQEKQRTTAEQQRRTSTAARPAAADQRSHPWEEAQPVAPVAKTAAPATTKQQQRKAAPLRQSQPAMKAVAPPMTMTTQTGNAGTEWLDNLSLEQLRQGVIMAEILGPCKARKHLGGRA